jgi:hypothetical protein
MHPTKFRFIWQSCFRREDFFRNQPIRNKNCLWWPCLLTDRDGINNLYRGSSIDTSYHVSDHLDMRFQRRRLKKHRPIRNKNCLWRPCLLMDRDNMSNLYRGPSIDASYQVSLHLAERFQRRRLKCGKLTDDRWRTSSDGKSSHCCWQGELNILHGHTHSLNLSLYFLCLCCRSCESVVCKCIYGEMNFVGKGLDPIRSFRYLKIKCLSTMQRWVTMVTINKHFFKEWLTL